MCDILPYFVPIPHIQYSARQKENTDVHYRPSPTRTLLETDIAPEHGDFQKESPNFQGFSPIFRCYLMNFGAVILAKNPSWLSGDFRTFLAWFLLMLAFNLLLLNLTGKHVRCPKKSGDVLRLKNHSKRRGGRAIPVIMGKTNQHVGRYCWYLLMATRNPAFTSCGNGSWSHYLQGFIVHVRWCRSYSWVFLLSLHSFAVTKVFVDWIEISWPTVMFHILWIGFLEKK